MLRLICGYAPRSGGRLDKNLSFYDELTGEWDMHSAGGVVMCLGDFNGHVPRHMDGFNWVHGVDQRNLEGRMSLEFCQEKELCVKYMV